MLELTNLEIGENNSRFRCVHWGGNEAEIELSRNIFSQSNDIKLTKYCWELVLFSYLFVNRMSSFLIVLVNILSLNGNIELSYLWALELINYVNREINLIIEWSTDIPYLIRYFASNTRLKIENNCCSNNGILLFIHKWYFTSYRYTDSRDKLHFKVMSFLWFNSKLLFT